MKKVFACFAVALFAFYGWGYQLVFLAVDAFANKQLSEQIQAGSYEAERLITLSVDLQLPYAVDWPAPERVRGEVVIDGVPYTFVERIYRDGKMTYTCLPDMAGMRIQEARNAVEKLNYENDTPADGSTKKSQASAVKKIITEVEEISIHEPVLCLDGLQPQHRASYQRAIPSPLRSVATPPPDATVLL